MNLFTRVLRAQVGTVTDGAEVFREIAGLVTASVIYCLFGVILTLNMIPVFIYRR